MRKKSYEIGDKACIFGIAPYGKLRTGTVVHKFRLPDCSFDHYVIEIPTHIDPLLEIRNAMTMWDPEDPRKGSLS